MADTVPFYVAEPASGKPPGPYRPVKIMGHFKVDGRYNVRNIPGKIRRPWVKTEIFKVVKKSCEISFNKQGFKEQSKKLRNFATNEFNVSVTSSGHVITVIALWNDPQIKYAYAQLFGANIRPKVKEYLSWVDAGGVRHFSKFVHIPPHDYLQLDNNCYRKITTILTSSLRTPFNPIYDFAKKQPVISKGLGTKVPLAWNALMKQLLGAFKANLNTLKMFLSEFARLNKELTAMSSTHSLRTSIWAARSRLNAIGAEIIKINNIMGQQLQFAVRLKGMIGITEVLPVGGIGTPEVERTIGRMMERAGRL